MPNVLSDIIKDVFGSAFSFVRGFTPEHKGIDLSASKGTPVNALASGTVVYSSFAGGGGSGYVHSYAPPTNATDAAKYAVTGGGNAVIIQTADGKQYHYDHLDTRNVKVGDSISAGSTIGTVGDTGDATGSHLHFSIYDTASKSFIDPTDTLTTIDNTSVKAQQFLDSYFSEFVGTATWGEAVTQIKQDNKVSDTQFIALYDALTALGLNGNSPITQADYDRVRKWLGNPANLAGGVSFNFVPDIAGSLTNVGYFIGFVLIGITFLLIAALVSRNSQGSMVNG